jgi:hypothetical protein
MTPAWWSRQKALPTEPTGKWVEGCKAANLVTNGAEIKFAPMYADNHRLDGNGIPMPTSAYKPYGIAAEATCQIYRHEAPHRPCKVCGCKCGFYAVDLPNMSTVLRYMRRDISHGWNACNDNLVILCVSLKGGMYTGKVNGTEVTAYRAAYQQVTLVLVPPNCGSPDCFGKPVALGVFGEAPRRRHLRGYQYLRPVCAEHATMSTITLQQCSDRLQVPVDWYNPLMEYKSAQA